MSGSKPVPERFVLPAAAVLALAALAAYHGIFSVPFVFDDFNAVTLNSTIRHLAPPWEVLRTPQGTGSETDGRPLANLSLAVNYAISGTAPWSYHALALLLHVGVALALFGVLRRTLGLKAEGWRAKGESSESGARGDSTLWAFVIALLWTVHPLLTETVTTVAHRTELLVSLFYLLTLYFFIRYAEVAEKRVAGSSQPDRILLSAFRLSLFCSCVLGMLSKEVMVSAPLIVFLYDRTFVAGSFAEAWRRRRALHLGLAGTWLILLVLRLAAPGRGGTGGFGLGMSPWHYALTQCRALVLYLRLSFWPHPLILDYGDSVVRQLGAVWPQGLAVLALLAATGLALWRRPALGFAGACFFAILAPSSSFLPLVTQTIAEHRMYLPLAAVLSVAVCGLRAAGGALRRESARPMAGALAATAVVLGLATARRNHDYQSGVSIWADTAAKLPGNPRAHDNLANALLEVNRRPEAIAEYETALRIDPQDVQAHYNLGNELLASGELAGAIEHYRAALHTFPSFVLAHDNLGDALLRSGRLAEAIEQYAEAVQSNPAHPGAHYNLANALAKGGRLTAAIGEYEAALRLAPDMADAHFNLALALVRAGRREDAMEQYRIVLRLNPADADARRNLDRLQGP